LAYVAALLLTRSRALLRSRISQKAKSTVLSASDKRDIKREVKKLEVSLSPPLSSLSSQASPLPRGWPVV